MQTKLTQLIRELKNEKCPQRVRDHLRGRIAAKESSSRRLRLAIPVAFAVVVLLCGLFVWQQQAREHARQQARLAQLTLERAQVARQAEQALGLVGSMLLSAGNDSGQIISDRTVPPLRNSFEAAKNKINQYIDL
jgi:CHASE1-domain containing sensor protein